MNNIKFNDKTYQCRDGETVLEALTRNGVELSFSCRKGSCHVCMLKCTDGKLPEESQKKLRPVFKKNDYFLPCVCKPVEDLTISSIESDELFSTAYIHKKEFLSDKVCRLYIDSSKFMDYRAGQFLNLSRLKDGVTRSYSVANCPEKDYFIELHIERMEGGDLSNWIFDELDADFEIDIQGPNGDCCYQPEKPQMPMLMVATNTGLAPVLGVVREAIINDHKADIHVYHVCRESSGLYLNSLMKELAKKHEHIYYHPLVAPGDDEKYTVANMAVSVVKSTHSSLQGWMVYLAGASQMVLDMRHVAIEKGVVDKNIFSDTFDLKDLRLAESAKTTSLKRRFADNSEKSPDKVEETAYPEPDLEIWEALGKGKKLNKILDDFYTIVYDDERLSPFFANVTKQRSIEKVYLFLRQVFTGDKVYIGDRPRNAHHWMVISDDLFDYREEIMMQCLRNNNIPENIIRRWRAIEEKFRPDIVKDKAWNKIVDGVERPVDGYEEMTLDCGAMCDSCHQPIDSGTKVRYHVRLGEVYCASCMSGS